MDHAVIFGTSNTLGNCNFSNLNAIEKKIVFKCNFEQIARKSTESAIKK